MGNAPDQPDLGRLKALAHPVRFRMLGVLGDLGAARAADLAAQLEIPANQASFHLRQLARYGLVEPAPEAARDKRDRVWRLAPGAAESANLVALERDPAVRGAIEGLRSELAQRAHRLVEAAFVPTWERAEGDYLAVLEDSLMLTTDEARQLADELSAVVAAHRERTREAGGGRRRYVLMSMLQPSPEA